MINLTTAAAFKLETFITDKEVVRLAGEGGGCNGFQYRFGVQPDDEVEADDHNTKASDGVRLCIDPISYQYLENVEIDFEESSFSSAFKINNPDVKATCGCGSSFS